jgi:hypothetical protein
MGESLAGHVPRESRQTKGRASALGMPRPAQGWLPSQQHAAGNEAVTRPPHAQPHYDFSRIPLHSGQPRNNGAHSPGLPLDPRARSYFEPLFRHDFSSVRVHTDAEAARSAEELRVVAYTVGDHIVLSGGQFRAGPEAQRRVLAHELAHVVQQHGGGGAPGPAQEVEADTAVHAIEPAARPWQGAIPPTRM